MITKITKMIDPKTFGALLEVNGVRFSEDEYDTAEAEIMKFDRCVYGEYFRTSSDQTQTFGTLEAALDHIDRLHRH